MFLLKVFKKKKIVMKIVAPKSGTYNASTCAKNLHEHVMAHVAEVNPGLARVYVKVREDDVVIPY